MFERFSPELRQAVLIAAEEVTRPRGDTWIGTEHLLVGAASVASLPCGDPPLEATALRAKDAMRRALRIGIDEGHRRITPHHLLAALALGRPNDPAIRLLHTAGIDPSTLRHSIWSSGRFGTAGPPEFWTV
ncbi:MAG TPA: Clp protease N-terminal domain-containing protein [Acidimicrobiia bacterium]|nr:Clp protease N-terminal domain-containing protein [Acidimicrobiia bacterium]